MDNDKIIKLICSFLNNKATESEKDELNRWVDQDLRNKLLFDNFQLQEFIQNGLENYRKFNAYDEWSSIESHFNKRARRLRLRKITTFSSSIAAVIIIASFLIFHTSSNHYTHRNETTFAHVKKRLFQPIIISNGKITTIPANVNEIVIDDVKIENYNSKISYSNINDTLKATENTIVVPSMCTYSVQLSDCTIVTLNANSEMTYPTKFEGEIRSVAIKGEAYFEVAKNKKPFYVKTNGIDIKVYGTKFNVNCNVKNEVRATLLSGKISVKNGGGKELILKPNEMAVVDIKTNTVTKTEIDTRKSVAWINNCFYCKKDLVNLLLSSIEKWYGVQFDYDEELFKNTEISATYNRDLSIENILKSLSDILNVKFIKIKQNKYEIVSN